MPRRSPPTALRLASGPTPPRGVPRHTMPSYPQPTFQPPSMEVKGPIKLSRPCEPVQLNLEGSSPISRAPSPLDPASPQNKVERGPWDHHSSIKLDIDLSSLLPPLQRAVILTL